MAAPWTNPSPGVVTDGGSGLPADLEHVHGMPAAWPSAWSPAVVALTDAATIAINTALGNVFRVTLGGNRTLGAPSNTPQDGQDFRVEVTQDATGSRTLAYASAYDWGAAGAPTLSTAAGKMDILTFKYNATLAKFCGSSMLGF